MEVLNQLRVTIDSVRPGLSDFEAGRLRQEMLDLISGLNGNGHGNGHKTDDAARHQKLSRRENEVMTMLLQGQRLKEIAVQLQISVKTVTTHRARLLRKLGLSDNLGLYRYGVRHGLIEV